MQLYLCDHCKTMKPIDAFYPYAKRKCKQCFKEYRQKWEKENPDKVSAKCKRRWAKHRDRYLERDRQKRAMGSAVPTKRSKESLEQMRLYRKAHRVEWNAKAKVRYAVLTGKMVRPNECSRCGYKCTPQAHHYDYSKPLDVVWFCASCHKRLHLGSL